MKKWIPPNSHSHQSFFFLSKLSGWGWGGWVKSQVSPQGQRIEIYWAGPAARWTPSSAEELSCLFKTSSKHWSNLELCFFPSSHSANLHFHALGCWWCSTVKTWWGHIYLLPVNKLVDWRFTQSSDRLPSLLVWICATVVILMQRLLYVDQSFICQAVEGPSWGLQGQEEQRPLEAGGFTLNRLFWVANPHFNTIYQ